MDPIHPELSARARFLPRSVHPRLIVQVLQLTARLRGSRKAPRMPVTQDVLVEDFAVPGLDHAPAIRVRVYRPAPTSGLLPAMLWIHGGGFVMGDSEIDQDNNIAIVRELGIAVAAVNYRLSPQHRFPAALEDCYAALRWLHARAATLGVLPDRIAIGGASAGAGLAAGLTLMALDRGEVPIAFQLLIYPMLDDRTATRTDMNLANVRLWNSDCNRFGWHAYLGQAPGTPDVHPYAAPARRENLSGLPPTWIGVGTCDLFHEEDLRYARRLTESAVACELRVVPGAYHGFDQLNRNTSVVREFRQQYLNAIKRALLA